MREVTVEAPDALVNAFTGERMRDAKNRAGKVKLDDVSDAAARAREAVAPTLQKGVERAITAATAAREQAAPRLHDLAERGKDLAESARSAGENVLERSREEWLPSARHRWDEAVPVVGDAVQSGVEKATDTAAVLGAGAAASARSAATSSKHAARSAAGATGSAIADVFSLLFWIALAAWLLIRIFRPNPRDRAAFYARIRRLTGFESRF